MLKAEKKRILNVNANHKTARQLATHMYAGGPID